MEKRGERAILSLLIFSNPESANTQDDCEQLFRRVLLNIRIHNTDDHLRNHGFFVNAQGVRLSPAYDINPSVDHRELSLAIDETESTCDISVAMAAHKAYGISSAQADAALKSVEAAVAEWRTEATRFRIPRAEQELMAAAFEYSDSLAMCSHSLNPVILPRHGRITDLSIVRWGATHHVGTSGAGVKKK